MHQVVQQPRYLFVDFNLPSSRLELIIILRATRSTKTQTAVPDKPINSRRAEVQSDVPNEIINEVSAVSIETEVVIRAMLFTAVSIGLLYLRNLIRL